MKRFLSFLTALVLLLCSAASLAETAFRDTLGAVDGGTYINPFLGLGCDLPSWYFFSRDEILKENQFPESSLDDSLKTIMKSTSQVLVMEAVPDLSGTRNVKVCIARITWKFRETIKQTGFTALLPALMADMKRSYQSAGMEDIEMRQDTVLIDGKEIAAIDVRFSQAGAAYRNVYALFPFGDYMITIQSFVHTSFTDDAAEVFSHFFWLNKSEDNLI